MFQIFLEPEGLESDVYYVQGLSMTFTEPVQQKIVNLIRGLESAKVTN